MTLTELRGKVALTQRQLARELSKSGLNFSQTTIALYELGLRTPSLERAKIIAQYFGVPVESIIFGRNDCVLQSTGTDNP